jgi:Ser/Thr protein kinase RdoA (MazF antagonist)
MNDATPTLIDRARRLLETPVPPVEPEDAARLARHAFGYDGTARRLSGERDANFLVEAPDRAALVVKFINDAEPLAETDMQVRVLDHLEAARCPLARPRAVRTRDGGATVAATTAAGRMLRARAYSFVPGQPVATAPIDDETRRRTGRTAALTARALRDFSHPAASRLNLWNLCEVGHLAPLVRYIEPTDLADRLAAVVDHFVGHVLPEVPGLRHQVIHNDLSPSNTILCGEAGDPLGVVDFGDMNEAPLLAELAVAASYQISAETPARDLEVMTAAFEAVTPLTPDEQRLLPDFVMARLAARILIGGWRAELFPENRAYIQRSWTAARAAFQAMDAGRRAAGPNPRG